MVDGHRNVGGAIVGGMAATAGGLALAQRFVPNGPTLRGNVAPALVVGAMAGGAGAYLSEAMGSSALADVGAVAGIAGMGALMMSGKGARTAGVAGTAMGVAALGGVLLSRVGG